MLGSSIGQREIERGGREKETEREREKERGGREREKERERGVVLGRRGWGR